MKSTSLFLIVASSVFLVSSSAALPLQSSSLSTTTTDTPPHVFYSSQRQQQKNASSPSLHRREASVPSAHADRLHVKRAAGSFAHEHSPAFNVVHVIAAIIGVVAAAAIGVTAFVVCRRRNRRRRLSEKVPLPHETPSATAHEQPPTPSSAVMTHKTSRFDQFASDFTYDERNTSGCSSQQQPHAGVSPVMQQAELQSRLMQSVKVNPPPPPYQP